MQKKEQSFKFYVTEAQRDTKSLTLSYKTIHVFLINSFQNLIVSFLP